MSYGTPIKPKAYTVVALENSNFDGANLVEFDGIATYVQIWVYDCNVMVRLNQDNDAIFGLEANDIMTLETMHITSVDFYPVLSSGSSEDATIKVLAGVVSQ